MNILLIEDDLEDVEYISQIFADEKITVLNSPPKDIDKNYDLIIIDYFFDGETSFSFLEYLDSKKLNIPVLIISGKIGEVDLENLPLSLNAMTLSKNEKFRELLKYYANLLCPKDDFVAVDYKTLFLDLVHDLRNDLTMAAFYRDSKHEIEAEDLEEIKERVIASSEFAYSRLDKMSTFLNSREESFSSLKEAYKQIEDSLLIMENKEAISLEGEVDKDLPFISTFFLSVILKNLIENSCKYRDPKRSLRVIVKLIETSDHHILTVGDNSLGMSEESSKNLFRKKSESKEGLGIGLIVLNRIITSLKGSIKVHSQVGVGTTVMVSFPKQS